MKRFLPYLINLPLAVLALILLTADNGPSDVYLEQITVELERPVGTAVPPDSSNRIFIIEKGGTIRIIDADGHLLPMPFLDLSRRISTRAERGLLGLAFDPDYVRNGFFYVNYTNNVDQTIVARYQVSADDPNRADPYSAVLLLRIKQPTGNHNAGHLAFGPDGMLYISTGDGGGAASRANSQDLTNLLGKLLRIDVSGATGARPYRIPPDNPYSGTSDIRPEIWAFGLRNPWRFTFDASIGDLIIFDPGQDTFEEINIQPASSPGGENYGWPIMEGHECFLPGTSCDSSDLTPPVLTYPHSAGNLAIVGGVVYRGQSIPSLHGAIIYADYGSGRIWAAYPGDGYRRILLLDTDMVIAAVSTDPRGEILLVGYRSGSLLRLAAGH